MSQTPASGYGAVDQSRQFQVAATSFVALFSIVGLALYGLPFYYDFMVREMGWSLAGRDSDGGATRWSIDVAPTT